MRFFDYLKLAGGNLLRRKLRTFLTTIAVVIGAIAVTALVSLGQNVSLSFAKMIKDLGALSMVTISPDPDSENGGMFGTNGGDTTGGKKIDDTTVAVVKKINHILDAAPIVNVWFESMQMKEGGKKIRSSILAFDPRSKAFAVNVSAGRTIAPDDIGKIILGAGSARALGYGDKTAELVGKKVYLNTKGWYSGWGVEVSKPPQNAGEEWWKEREKQRKQIEVEIIGVAASTGEDWQDYTNLTWARMLRTRREWRQSEVKNGEINTSNIELVSTDEIAENGYNIIIAKADDPENTDTIVAEVQKLGYGATTAKEMIDKILKVIKLIGEILAAIGGVSLIVAAIGIINTMAMAIFERRREIGLLRACGATRASVRRLFTLEAALIGLGGGVVGLAITFVLAKIANFLAEKYGSASAIPIDDFVYFPSWLIFGVIAFTTIIGIFSGLYPAFKAARLNPVAALKQNN